METGKRPSRLIPRYTTDAGEYLDRVGVFLRRRPVEHSVLLTTASTRVGEEVAAGESNLWLWVEDDEEVVAAAQHTPPRGAYLSTGPAEAMRKLARTLWQLRTGLRAWRVRTIRRRSSRPNGRGSVARRPRRSWGRACTLQMR